MFNVGFFLYHPGDLGNAIYVVIVLGIVALVCAIGLPVFLLIKLGLWLNRRNERKNK